MGIFIVEGPSSLSGTIRATGNKNEALPAVAAAMLCSDTVELSNFPDIVDLRKMLNVAAHMGATVSPIEDGRVSITADSLEGDELPVELSSRIRGSILFASALLVRRGRALVDGRCMTLASLPVGVPLP